MKSLYYDGKISLKDIPQPEPSPGEALIKTRLAGFCATDREIAAGYMNFKGVPGHEFVGEVVQADESGWVGKRVVGEINAGCGECEYCRKDLARHCPTRTTLGIMGRNGVFAEYFTLPAVNLLEIPDEIPDRAAVFIEPLAAALEIAEQIRLEPEWGALIIGDGKLAALIAQTLRLHGINLLVAGKIPKKTALFSRWGIDTTLQTPPAASFDIVIEASGSPGGWENAVKAVKPRGTIVLKSTYHGALDFNPAPLVVNEITLLGSRCGRFPPAIRLLKQGLIETEPLISRVFPFEQILKAFEYAQNPQTFKALVEFPR